VGPWSKSFVKAVVGRTERPSDGALADVRDLTVDVGLISARVGACAVTIGADPVPPRIWAAMTRFAGGRGPLEQAVAGRIQSVHLEHLMAEDWGEPLVPRARALARACTCDGENVCEHVVATAFTFADRLDDDPQQLLRWRGCIDDPPAVKTQPAAPKEERRPEDPWHGGALPDSGEPRVVVAGAVLKRLGPSQLRVGDEDLSDVLGQAYDRLGSSGKTAG
jgi:uncharacterized Zn finger protein